MCPIRHLPNNIPTSHNTSSRYPRSSQSCSQTTKIRDGSSPVQIQMSFVPDVSTIESKLSTERLQRQQHSPCWTIRKRVKESGKEWTGKRPAQTRLSPILMKMARHIHPRQSSNFSVKKEERYNETTEIVNGREKRSGEYNTAREKDAQETCKIKSTQHRERKQRSCPSITQPRQIQRRRSPEIRTPPPRSRRPHAQPRPRRTLHGIERPVRVYGSPHGGRQQCR